MNEARAELEPASGTDPPLPDAGDGADAHLGAVVHHRRHAGTRQALGAKFRQQECLFSHFLLPGTEAISRDDPAGPHPGSLRVTGTALPGRCRAQAQHSSALCPPPGSSASPRATPALGSTQSSPASDKGSGQQRGLCPPRAGRDTAQGHCTGTQGHTAAPDSSTQPLACSILLQLPSPQPLAPPVSLGTETCPLVIHSLNSSHLLPLLSDREQHRGSKSHLLCLHPVVWAMWPCTDHADQWEGEFTGLEVEQDSRNAH